jgi:hypothetical protein
MGVVFKTGGKLVPAGLIFDRTVRSWLPASLVSTFSSALAGLDGIPAALAWLKRGFSKIT